jgi:hypothetical protein
MCESGNSLTRIKRTGICWFGFGKLKIGFSLKKRRLTLAFSWLVSIRWIWAELGEEKLSYLSRLATSWTSWTRRWQFNWGAPLVGSSGEIVDRIGCGCQCLEQEGLDFHQCWSCIWQSSLVDDQRRSAFGVAHGIGKQLNLRTIDLSQSCNTSPIGLVVQLVVFLWGFPQLQRFHFGLPMTTCKWRS